MLRVSDQIREQAVAAVVQYQHADRQGWAEYLAEADELAVHDPAIAQLLTV
ncbi:MAG TPA: hypothetical protein VHI14_09790 [Jatrophihabitantaceae bacterium]|nr:hypothetical protein [Jatrophihabitantaceae bacterium]